MNLGPQYWPVALAGAFLALGGLFPIAWGTNPLPGKELQRSADAYVRQSGTQWIFGTSKVQKTIVFEKGHLRLASFRNEVTHREYIQGPSEVFRFGLDGVILTGESHTWALTANRAERAEQGELRLTIAVRDEKAEVSKHFIIYPHESIIQEWLSIKNLSAREIAVSDPFFLQVHMMQKQASQLDFSYMTGGKCFWGSWILKTQPLTSAYFRNFDAGDPPECLPGQPCPKGWDLGNSIYAPIYVFFNRLSNDGAFVGWDYLGRWGSSIGNYNGGPVNVGLKLSAFTKTLGPAESLDTPMAFTGAFSGDLDDMGNQLLDYQYRYKWDYTRPEYFPAVQMLGYWWKGAADFDLQHLGMDVDLGSTFRKTFRAVDLMRYVGADIYWRDYGWWDLAGEWRGPDFGETRRYLHKYGMQQTLYAVVYNAEQGSTVIDRHPDWTVKMPERFAGQYYLNQAKPGVTDFELNTLERLRRDWGDFEWRIDSKPARPISGDASPMLLQDRNFRELVKSFLDRNPRSAFHGCNDGGNGLGYELLRMASAWQYSDGCVGRYRVYYTSYLYPPDKLINMPDNWDPAKYEKSTWRGLLWSSFPMTGDTQDPAKMEGVRQLIDIYHYLAKEGVVGRWVRIYHPHVNGDTPDWYLQRMSGDQRRGVIIPAHYLKTALTIYPKGLLPEETYNVSFQESPSREDRTGADLMANGLPVQNMPDGGLVYLNLPMHPGSLADHVPPSSPQRLEKRIGTNMDEIGVELNLLPATDNNWISYYEILRNGKVIDKVAKGTYYFDHSVEAGLGARYDVRAVDGSGNFSPTVSAPGSSRADAFAVDDSSGELRYTGEGWKHEGSVWGVFNGTQSSTAQAGDAVAYRFRGNRIIWYGRLGDAMGKAEVYIDGQLDQMVDTYDADDMPNVALYSRTFAAVGEHEIRIVAMGSHHWRSGGDWIVLDGFKVGVVEATVVEDKPGEGIQYTGTGWRHTNGWDRASGGSLSWTKNVGDAAEYTFDGDGITWVGKRCPACGRADVFVDGALDATVDSFGPDVHPFRVDLQGGWQVPLYQKTWTTAGRHNVRIVVKTNESTLGRGSELYLDCFQVSRR